MDQTNEPILTIDEIISLVNQSYISTIRQSLMEIFRVINDPGTSASDLTEIIERDPPLCAKVIRLANSAYYGSRRYIDEIKQAIVWLGFNTVKELALSQKICELFHGADQTIGSYSRGKLWKHSAAVALCGKMIYRRELRDPGYVVYTAGLLHDIGIIIEDQFIHESFVENVLEAESTQKDLYLVESANQGITHQQIGYAVAENWGFPANLTGSIGFHHTPEQSMYGSSKLIQVLYVANYICQRNDIGYSDALYSDADTYQICLEQLGIDQISIDLITEDLISEILKMEQHGWF